MFKESKWARKIVSAQDDNGLWGIFHSLAQPTNKALTTEQALRRLEILGYTIKDKPIIKCVNFMEDCLKGKKIMPDRREKTHDWDLFTELMLATWIRRFTLESDLANKIADDWGKIVSEAVHSGRFNHSDYLAAYIKVFSKKAVGDRFLDPVNFYQVSLLSNQLSDFCESIFVDYVLNYKTGIYYIGYFNSLVNLPNEFCSKECSRFVASIELLAKYKNSTAKLKFAKEWIYENRNLDGKWDFGSKSKDHIYLPLSDSWRNTEKRIDDSTYRINQLLQKF